MERLRGHCQTREDFVEDVRVRRDFFSSSKAINIQTVFVKVFQIKEVFSMSVE